MALQIVAVAIDASKADVIFRAGNLQITDDPEGLYLFRAEFDLATIADRCGVHEETIFARLPDIKQIAGEIRP